MDQILYIDEVLKQLNIKISFLYKLINSNQIQSFKMGRRRAFMQSEIDKFIQSKAGRDKSNVIDIKALSPAGAMAKGLTDISWHKYSFEQLCKVWALIGDLEAKGT